MGVAAEGNSMTGLPCNEVLFFLCDLLLKPGNLTSGAFPILFPDVFAGIK